MPLIIELPRLHSGSGQVFSFSGHCHSLFVLAPEVLFEPCPSQARARKDLTGKQSIVSLQFAHKYFKLLAASQFVSGICRLLPALAS
jgi:hypothetical protein